MSPKLPSRYIIGFAILIVSAVVLLIIMAIVNCLRKRNRKTQDPEKRRNDRELGRQEAQHPRATLPNITIDTNVPPVRRFETFSPPSYPLGHHDIHLAGQAPAPTPSLNQKSHHKPIRSNTVACHSASIRPGTTPTGPTLTTPYAVTRSARPSFNRASTAFPKPSYARQVSQVQDDTLKRTMSLDHSFGEEQDVMGIKNPVQVYDPVNRRTIYYG